MILVSVIMSEPKLLSLKINSKRIRSELDKITVERKYMFRGPREHISEGSAVTVPSCESSILNCALCAMGFVECHLKRLLES